MKEILNYKKEVEELFQDRDIEEINEEIEDTINYLQALLFYRQKKDNNNKNEKVYN